MQCLRGGSVILMSFSEARQHIDGSDQLKKLARHICMSAVNIILRVLLRGHTRAGNAIFVFEITPSNLQRF